MEKSKFLFDFFCFLVLCRCLDFNFKVMYYKEHREVVPVEWEKNKYECNTEIEVSDRPFKEATTDEIGDALKFVQRSNVLLWLSYPACPIIDTRRDVSRAIDLYKGNVHWLDEKVYFEVMWCLRKAKYLLYNFEV